MATVINNPTRETTREVREVPVERRSSGWGVAAVVILVLLLLLLLFGRGLFTRSTGTTNGGATPQIQNNNTTSPSGTGTMAH